MKNPSLVKQLLSQGSFTVINKPLMKRIGLDCAYMFQYLLDLQDNCFEGEFFQQQERLAEEFGWSVYKVQTVTKQLASFGLLNMARRGMPAKIYYSINPEQVIAFLDDKLSVISSENIQDKSLEIDIHNTIETPITSYVEIKEQVMGNLGVIEHTNIKHTNKQNKDKQTNININVDNTSAEIKDPYILNYLSSQVYNSHFNLRDKTKQTEDNNLNPEYIDKLLDSCLPIKK